MLKRSVIMALAVMMLGIPAASVTTAQQNCVNTYTVFDGDTLLNIAQRFNVDMNELAALNNIQNPRLIYIGDVLCLDGLVVAQPAPGGTDDTADDTTDDTGDDTTDNTGDDTTDDTTDDTGDDTTDDTTDDDGDGTVVAPDLVGFALHEQFQGKELFEITFGGKTYRTDNRGYYTVEPGDNLYRVALAFGVSSDRLIALNGIADPGFIYAGQRLFIPEFTSVPAPASFPVIQIIPGQAGPGDTITVEGFNYPANTDIELYFEKTREFRISDLIETVTTDEDGYFSTELVVIDTWTGGDPVNQRTVSVSGYEVNDGPNWAMNFFINSAWGQ
ncbi:MAG: LysM peptidoglycan-binding domain-containing protein [Chloroflexi bacterium]|nr:LysM peptidoglycan-binding domain-containing protein [Chloroflexota bacterium]